MNAEVIIAVVLLVACALTFVLTHLSKAYSIAIGRIAIPNERSSHKTPTPTGGGIAIVFAVYLTSPVLWVLGGAETTAQSTILFAFLLSAGLVAAVGYIDDGRGLASWQRLAVHLVCATVCVYFIGAPGVAFPDFLPVWVTAVGTVLAIVWCLNLFNFMDGTDGIAASEALTVGGVTAVLIYIQAPDNPAWVVMALLAVTSLAFLFWNWPPAKIFMGDVASGFIGFSIAVVALWTIVEEILNVWVWLIIPGMFFIDASLTLVRRLYRRERLYEAHCSHAYQCAVRLLEHAYCNRRGGRHPSHPGGRARTIAHRYVSSATIAVTLLWLTPLSLLAIAYPRWGFAWTLLAWVSTGWVLVSIQNAWHNSRHNEQQND